MNKTPGNLPGVSVHCGGPVSPTKNREILQASPTAKLRLEALLWAGWLTLGGVRP